MNNQEKLQKLIENGELDKTGSAIDSTLKGAELEEFDGIAIFWFHGKSDNQFANFCAKEFKTDVHSPASKHLQVVTSSSKVKKWLEK